MNILETVLGKMSNINKAQRNFMVALLMNLMRLRGKANYRNLSRYSDYHEKSYSRWFKRDFDFLKFNMLSLEHLTDKTLILAVDCSFISKSGKHTYGLGKFYNGKQGKAEKGLEISTLALIDVDYNTAYNLSTRQTCPVTEPNKTRVDQYLSHIKQDCMSLPEQIHYLVADGYYSKTKFIDGVTELGLEFIGKLRHDASLRWLYQGTQKPLGRHKMYDGKVKFDDLNDFDLIDEIKGIKLYTTVVNSPCFKRNLRIVYLVKKIGKKVHTALLFSTDLQLLAKEIYQFYKARFQIEFLFRDAKQFTGLNDCQALSRQALNFHFNAAMTALNLMKLEDRLQGSYEQRHVISIASWNIRNANAHLLERFSSWLGFDFKSIKYRMGFDDLCNYGAPSF
jgi:IS4 transposase